MITELLATYGQGGNCGFTRRRSYHNSFLLADPHEAWVLETVGSEWAARQVHGVYTISNGITIGNEWDLASPDLVSFAVQKGWCRSREDFDFSRCYSDFTYTTFSASRSRRRCTINALTAQQGKNSVATVIAALRSHGAQQTANWSPDRGLSGPTVCMHASFGPIRTGQTTGSLVCHLHPEHPTHFVTASAAPCTGIFKPVWLDTPPPVGREPTGIYDPDSLFWQHELLHRATLRDYVARLQVYKEDRDRIEHEMTRQALSLSGSDTATRAAFVAECFNNAARAEQQWLEQIATKPVTRGQSWLHRHAWDTFNRQAKMP